MVRTRTDTDKKTIVGAKVKANPFSKFLLDLLDNPNLSDELGKKDLINTLGIKESDFTKLVDYLEDFFGLKKGPRESWLQFLERAAYEVNGFDNVAEEITEGFDKEKEANMKVLLENLDEHEKELEKSIQKIRADLRKYNQSELERYLTALKEKQNGKLPSPNEIDKQAIAQVAAEIEIKEQVRKFEPLVEIETVDPQTKLEQNQKRFNDILDINRRQVETIVRANEPKVGFSDQELEVISTASLGTNTSWHQPIQQKCDNYAEIIKQIKTVADTKTLAQQAKVAEKVQPVVEKHTNIDPEITKKVSQNIAGSLMTAKSQGWDLKPIPNTEAAVAAPQIALAFESEGIELEEPLAISEIAAAVQEPLSEMGINSQQIRQMNHISVQAGVAKHLNNKGLNLTPVQTNQTVESIGYGFHIPFHTGPIEQAYKQTHQGKGEEVTQPNLLNRLRIIPPQSNQVLQAFHNDPYKQVFKQIFTAHYAQMTPKELKGQISLLSQMQSHARTTTVSGPVINLHTIQLNAAQTVIDHPLYQAMSPLVKFSKSKIGQKLGQTAIGKGFKTGINKAGSWLAQKIGIAGIELAGEGAASGTIAAALGVPSGGASLLVWAGWELLKIGAKKIFGGIKKFIKGVGSTISGFFADVFSSGKAETSRQKAGILETLQKGAPAIGAAISSLIALPSAFNVGPIIVTSFIIFFGVTLLGFFPQHLMTQSRQRPPLGRGGEGVPQAELGIDAIEVDLSTCDIPSANAKTACTLSKAFKQCFSGGEITSSNSHLVEECIRKTEALMTLLSESQIDHIVSSITYSANTYDVLQCVGFKRGVEPGLPGCGDAKDFANNGCNQCRPADSIQPGINAVYTGGAFGHIAIVLETDEENGLVTLAQAWGGSGRVNFTQVPIASVDEFIDCR